MAFSVDDVRRIAHLGEDVVTETDRHTLYQQGAPSVEDGLYLVPKVIE